MMCRMVIRSALRSSIRILNVRCGPVYTRLSWDTTAVESSDYSELCLEFDFHDIKLIYASACFLLLERNVAVKGESAKSLKYRVSF
jgi:hypothetical protein